MLERNLLSHLRLGVLLSFLSATIIVRTRLIPERGEGDPTHDNTRAGVVMGSVQALAALCTIVIGIWQYNLHFKDLYHSRAFLGDSKYVSDFCRCPSTHFGHSPRPHFSVMTAVAGVVLSTSVILLADENKL
jgi:hypothetical protein